MRNTRRPVSLKEIDLHDDGHGLEHEQAADDRQHDLVLGDDADGAERRAAGERPGVAHEHHRRRRVEPEEAEARADQRAAEHGKLAGAGHVMDLQIVGEHRVADQVGDQREAARGNHHRHDRQPVEPVGQIDRVRGADHHAASRTG